MTDKEELKEAYVEGYKTGRGTERLSDIAIRTATSRFERWFDLNKGESDE
jgi:hypothetical protein